MRRLTLLAVLSALALTPALAGAESDVVVAVDPLFAPVAQVLTQSFAELSGHALSLDLLKPGALPREADIVLAPDAELPRQLVQEGLADPATQVTYAMGAAGTEEATIPRDAILMHAGAEKPAAVEFMAFLMTSDAWDLIVTHGHGAY